MEEGLVKIGQITAPHGVRGEVRVFPLTDFPERFAKLKEVLLGEEARPVRVSYEGMVKNLAILKFEGIDDRNGAEKLRGQYLQVTRSQVPKLPEDTYYVFDLIGLAVTDESGEPLGVVKAVESVPAHDVYVVQTPDGKSFMVPAVKEFILRIDLQAKRMVIRPIPGLME